MIKYIILKIFEKFGYEVNKVYDNGHYQVKDAFSHNSLDMVNERNENMEYFKYSIEKDKIFINCFFSFVRKLFSKEKVDFLDMGCGTGILVNKLKKKFPKSNISGCDFSVSKIKQCQFYYNDRDRYFVHDIMLPLPSKYDIVTCTEVLEHLNKPEVAVYNLINALKKGGILSITVPDGRRDNFKGHIHFWSIESFKLFIDKEIKTKNNINNFEIEYGFICDRVFAKIKKTA